MSRTKRWKAAAEAARLAMGNLEAAKDAVEAALSELDEIREEYADWRDNLPENLHGTALYDKLEAVADMDLDIQSLLDLSELENAIDEAENADLPLGFGRD
jgi:uncharacterized protein YhaN